MNQGWRSRYRPPRGRRPTQRRRWRPPRLGILLFTVLIGVAIGSVLTSSRGSGLQVTPSSSLGVDIIGPASVIDGDTLEIQGRRIRLSSVDAPESRQTCLDGDGHSYRCGQDAANALADHIGGQTVACQSYRLDHYGRTIADCAVADQDLGSWLVRHGHAVDYVRYSHGKHSFSQWRAKREKRGIWVGAFEQPEAWRRDNRRW